jgi:hypothetical protein
MDPHQAFLAESPHFISDPGGWNEKIAGDFPASAKTDVKRMKEMERRQ